MDELINKFFMSDEKTMSVPASYIKTHAFLSEIEYYLKRNDYPQLFTLQGNKNTCDAVAYWIISKYPYKKLCHGSLIPKYYHIGDSYTIVITDDTWFTV